MMKEKYKNKKKKLKIDEYSRTKKKCVLLSHFPIFIYSCEKCFLHKICLLLSHFRIPIISINTTSGNFLKVLGKVNSLSRRKQPGLGFFFQEEFKKLTEKYIKTLTSPNLLQRRNLNLTVISGRLL